MPLVLVVQDAVRCEVTDVCAWAEMKDRGEKIRASTNVVFVTEEEKVDGIIEGVLCLCLCMCMHLFTRMLLSKPAPSTSCSSSLTHILFANASSCEPEWYFFFSFHRHCLNTTFFDHTLARLSCMLQNSVQCRVLSPHLWL